MRKERGSVRLFDGVEEALRVFPRYRPAFHRVNAGIRQRAALLAGSATNQGENDMANPEMADAAALLLRVSLAIMFFAHAWLKVAVFTPAGAAKYFASLGVPGWLAYLTILAEIAGGLLLLFGVGTRWVAIALIPLILGTIVLVHGRNGWLFTNKDGGWEYPAFWIVGLVALALLGDGTAALGPMLSLPF